MDLKKCKWLSLDGASILDASTSAAEGATSTYFELELPASATTNHLWADSASDRKAWIDAVARVLIENELVSEPPPLPCPSYLATSAESRLAAWARVQCYGRIGKARDH